MRAPSFMIIFLMAMRAEGSDGPQEAMGGRGALAARPPDSKPNGSKVAPAQRAIARRSRRALLPSGLDGEDERDDPYEEVRSTQAGAGEGEEMKMHHIRG